MDKEETTEWELSEGIRKYLEEIERYKSIISLLNIIQKIIKIV